MNKRKLSLIVAGSLTAISAVHAAPTEFNYNVKLNRMVNTKTGKFISWDTMARINADRALSLYAPSFQRNVTSGFAQSYGPYQATGNGALVPLSRVTIPASLLEKVLCYANPKRAVAAALALPVTASGIMAKGYYDASSKSLPVVEQVGFLAKAKSMFASYANKDAVQKGVNAVVSGVKNHKEAAIGAAGLVAFAGVMKAYEYYNAPTPTSAEEQTSTAEQTTPAVEQSPVVEQATPVVEQAHVEVASPIEKLTVAEIAKTQGANVQGVIDALKAHGYTKIDLKASDLKQAGNLNDGQVRFIISRIR